MTSLARPFRLAVAALVLGGAALPAAAAPAPGASAAPFTSAPAASRDAERLVIASCPRTTFYSWPAKDSAPFSSSYPPATNGDAFHIVGPVQQTLDGMALYETTIDVVEPYGAGKHYWVSQRCVNAG